MYYPLDCAVVQPHLISDILLRSHVRVRSRSRKVSYAVRDHIQVTTRRSQLVQSVSLLVESRIACLAT